MYEKAARSIVKFLDNHDTENSGVTRNSGALGHNIEWGPHKSWAMSLIPCLRYRTGYCRVDSLDCQPWRSFENR